MVTIFFSDEAYQDFDQLSELNRDLVNDLYEMLRRLEREGIPDQALPLPGLVDLDGVAVPGYLLLLGEFLFGLSQEGGAKIVIWTIRLVVRPAAEALAALTSECTAHADELDDENPS